MAAAIRVLIVDDSAMARSLLRAMFDSDPGFAVVAEAGNGREGVALAAAHRPDLVTMDLEMPEMGGIEAIAEIMATRPLPILVVSSFADARNAFAAVSRGAVDVIAKPDLTDDEVVRFLDKARLVASIRVITHMRALRPRPLPADAGMAPLPPPRPAALPLVFVIASSTGGPQALAQILGSLPPGFASPILVAQHVAPGFAAGLADWLSTVSALPVRLARHGEAVAAGAVQLSPSESHMAITAGGRIAFAAVQDGDIYRPSCNRLLDSVAAGYGRRAVGIILTGMGSDGAEGMRRLKTAGGRTIAQDEASSVVFGMNQRAIETGGIDKVLPLDAIAAEMIRLTVRG